jgi:hypothetical protein
VTVRGATAAVAVALAAAACGGPSPGPPTAPPPPPRTTASGCANASSVASRPALRRGPALRGDIDGDGRPDVAYVALDPAGPERCRFYLVVRSVDGVRRYATQLTPYGKGWRPIPADDRQILDQLRLNGLARISTDPGLEVLLDGHEGASTRFIWVYRVWRGDLQRILGAGESFPYSGSLTHENGVDCAPSLGAGFVVAGQALLVGAQGRSYAVERRYYLLRGARFVPVPALTEHDRVPVGGPGGFGAGIADTPFPSCRTASVR